MDYNGAGVDIDKDQVGHHGQSYILLDCSNIDPELDVQYFVDLIKKEQKKIHLLEDPLVVMEHLENQKNPN